MPRKNVPVHVLRRFRELVGMPQNRLADALGIPALTLRFYENGMRQMPPAVALRAFVETGIRLAEILKGADGKLIDNFGQRYTAEFYPHWKARFMVANERAARKAAADLGKWIEVLLLGSVRLDTSKLHPVIAAIVAALDGIRADFHLAPKVDGLLRERVPRLAWRPGFHHEHHVRLGELIASGQAPVPAAKPSRVSSPRTRRKA